MAETVGDGPNSVAVDRDFKASRKARRADFVIGSGVANFDSFSGRLCWSLHLRLRLRLHTHMQFLDVGRRGSSRATYKPTYIWRHTP